LSLPEDADEQAKYISEAVKAYPEIYFAKLVVLGEGDSEQVILPKMWG
jgi:predicted ATP-dependent endonuclease of OLD family